MRKMVKLALPAVLFLGLVMRLVIISQSFWLDEAIGAIVVKTFSFREILLKFPLTDNHPPIYYLILKGWSLIFGYSEMSLRMPSVIFGVATVYLVYKLAKEFTKINPLIPTLLLATSPLHIYYSQEARMYSLAAFLASGAIYFFLMSIRNGRIGAWVSFSVFYTLLAFSDYVPVFLYPVFIVYALWQKMDLAWWKKFGISNIPLVILGLAWLPTFLLQSQKGKWLLDILPAWREVAGGATIKQLGVFWSKFVFGRIAFSNKILYYILIFLASVPVVLLLIKSLKKLKNGDIFWLWFLAPVIFGFLASIFFPAFIYFRFIFVLPAFYVLIAGGKNKLLIPLVVGFNMLGWGIYVLDKTQWREDWRGAVGYIESVVTGGEAAVFENPEPFAPYRWYWQGKVQSLGVLDSISANAGPTQEIVKTAVKDKSGVYYFEYLQRLQDPKDIIRKTLTAQGFTEVEKKAFNGVGFVIHYVKKGAYAYRD
jgi:4-amino-4-deoxy-L-arabinose transferase-like glycosyltransferase